MPGEVTEVALMPEMQKLVYFAKREKLKELRDEQKKYEDEFKRAELAVKKRLIRSIEEGDQELVLKKMEELKMVE